MRKIPHEQINSTRSKGNALPFYGPRQDRTLCGVPNQLLFLLLDLTATAAGCCCKLTTLPRGAPMSIRLYGYSYFTI